MASVLATFCQRQPSNDGCFFLCPSSYPSWSSTHRNFISTSTTSSGFTTTWMTDDVIQLSITDPQRPKARCIAHFPSLARSHTPPSTCSSQHSSSSSRRASLVTSTHQFISIATHGAAEAIRTPVGGDPLTDPLTALELFTPPSGLILCTSNLFPTSYYYLAHPLQQCTLLSLPPQQILLNAFIDVPLLVTRAQETVTVWSCLQSDAPMLQSPSSSLSPYSIDAPTQSLLTLSTLQLTPLYDISVSSVQSVSSFLSHDVHGLLSLCIVADGVLTGLSIIQTDNATYKISPSFRIRDVTSAVSLLAVRRPQGCLDALVKHGNGTLSLFMGRNRLCEVKLPKLDVDEVVIMPGTQMSLCQPVSDEFSLLNKEGRGCRFSLESACFLCPLVNKCLAAVTYFFEEASAVTRITALYHNLLSARASVSQSTEFHPLKTDKSIEWSLFETILLHVNSQPSIETASEVAYMDIDSSDDEKLAFDEDDVDKGSDADWDALLRSDVHEEFIATKEFSSNPPRATFRNQADQSLAKCLPEWGFPHIDILKQVLHALHLLYEDFKLNSLCGLECRHLAALNHRLASLLGNFAYIDHYRRDFPELVEGESVESIPSAAGNLNTNSSVASITNYLAGKICGDESKQSSYPVRTKNGRLECNQDITLTASWRNQSPFHLSQKIINYYNILFVDNCMKDRNGSSNQKFKTFGECLEAGPDNDRYERLLIAMVADGFTTADIDALPFGVALPLRDALWNCRHQPNVSWPFPAFALIGREDLFNFADFDTYESRDKESSSLQLVRQSRAILQIHAAAAAASTKQANSRQIGLDKASDVTHLHPRDTQNEVGSRTLESISSFIETKGDGCELEAEIFRLRFLEDKRVNEVRRLLRSTDVIVMHPVEKSEQNIGLEFDMMAEQKLKLSGLLRKRLAAPVGRGAFTLRTLVPTDPTKPLPVPKVNMTGKLFGQNGAKVTYTPVESNQFQWGEFHNGVAAGLRIVAADNARQGGTDEILTRSWIINHRPSDASGGATHAGMLLALGLGGYLPVLKKTDYIQYLVPRHELTAIGLMLGLSAGNVGCANEKITKMLCLHIRPFNEAGFSVPEFHVTVNVQTSAVMGLGLLHLGTCEHSLLEGLFTELGRKPKPGDAIDNREGLALASGFSIGLLCLGHGTSAFDSAERRRVDRLILYANGGSSDDLSGSDSLYGFHGNGPSSVGNSRKIVMNMTDRTSSMAAAMAAAVAESETSRVMEGGFVNTDVVSPGALMALTLIYLKTNDRRLADRIILPDSLYSLGRVRADHVYLRILARCLIMWDDIEPTEEWLRKVIPALLLPVSHKSHGNFIDADKEDHMNATCDDIFNLGGRINISDFTNQYDVDVTGILQARAYAISGACTAIALKFAGTSNALAKALVIRACYAFEQALISPDCLRAKSGMEFVYGNGMCCTGLSLGIICAGSGNLEALKILRRLRKRGGSANQRKNRKDLIDEMGSVNVNIDDTALQDLVGSNSNSLGVGRYGIHMAIHMAIGFLFLGAGCQTFGTSHLAVVGLLCAIYFPFPRDVTDNQYHLQAFRHLYVLAVEPRCVETRDVDTGKWCSVDMQLNLTDGSHRIVRAPCIVPEAKQIHSLEIIGDRYLRNHVRINRPVDGLGWFSSSRPQVVFVKRKAGHLPYNIDPKGGKGILSRCLNRPKPQQLLNDCGSRKDNESWREENRKYFKQVEHLVKAFSADPEILAFVKFFCCVQRENCDSGSDSGSESDSDDDTIGNGGENERTNDRCKLSGWQQQKKRRQGEDWKGTGDVGNCSVVDRRGDKEKQYVEMLYDCLSNDKADAVKVYLDMERAVEDIERGSTFPYVIDNLMICEAYMLSTSVLHKNKSRLIRPDFVSGLLRKVRLRLQSTEKVRKALLGYVSSHARVWPSMVNQRVQKLPFSVTRQLAEALRLNAFPQVAEMGVLTEWIKRVGAENRCNNVKHAVWSTRIFIDSAFRGIPDAAIEFLVSAVEGSFV